MTPGRAYGWKPSPEHRRGTHTLGALLAEAVKPIDHSAAVISMLDQAATQYCVAHTGAQILRTLARMHLPELVPPLPSRRMLGRAARALDGSLGFDDGMTYASFWEALAILGWVPESQWPWDDAIASNDDPAVRQAWLDEEPPLAVVRDCADRRITHGVARLDVGPGLAEQVARVSAAGGLVATAWMIGSAFEEEVGPTVLHAADIGAPALGGHALPITGQRDDQTFPSPGSWGRSWRAAGWCRFAKDALEDASLCVEAWAVAAVAVSS